MILENEYVKLVLDDTRGCLESIMNKSLGKDYIGYKKYSQLFKMVYPVGNDRSNLFVSRDQKVTNKELLQTSNGSVLTLKYDKLYSKLGSFNVQARIKFELRNDECTLHLSMSNNDDGVLTQVFFPLISGVSTIGNCHDADSVVISNWGGEIIRNPMKAFPRMMEEVFFNENLATHYTTYPGSSSMQWMDFFCPTHGLYLASQNKRGEFLVLWFKKHTRDPVEYFSMATVKYPYLEKGHDRDFSPFVISPHQGDWHKAADKYRAWQETWLEKPRLPDWIRRTNGWMHLILRHQDGLTINEIDELPEIFRQAKEHGLNILFITGWSTGGHEDRYPYIPIDREKLKEAFSKIHEMGGKILLYMNEALYVHSDLTEWKRVSQWAVKRFDGSYAYLQGNTQRGPVAWEWALEHYPSFEGSLWAFMCQSAEGWSNEFADTSKLTSELGADITLFDVLGTHALLCFDKTHGHLTPDSAWGPGTINMMKKVLSAQRSINPNPLLCIEGLSEFYSPFVGIYHSRVDLVSLRGEGPAQPFPEMIRYTMPWLTGVTSGYIDVDDYSKLYQAFILGLPLDVEFYSHSRGRLSDSKILANKIKELNELRQEHIDMFVDGTFMDNIGIECDYPELCIKVFKSDKKLMLTIWNKNMNPVKGMIKVSPDKIGVDLKHPLARQYPGEIDVPLKIEDSIIYMFPSPVCPDTPIVIEILGEK